MERTPLMHIPDWVREQLIAKGLVVADEPFPSGHVAFPDGVVVAKPASTRGNHIPGYAACWGLDGPQVDAPALYLHWSANAWHVTAGEWVPGPGPGDFVHTWPTVDAAVADILDFYFGAPER